MTHPCCLDCICDFDEELLVLRVVLASYQNLDRKSAPLDLVKVFRCELSAMGPWKPTKSIEPFFWVVRM
jgi:hypothetical protein